MPKVSVNGRKLTVGEGSPLLDRAVRRAVERQTTLSEHDIQRQAVALMIGRPTIAGGVPNPGYRNGDGLSGRHPELCWLYAVPNEVASKAQAFKRKAEGMAAGVPDLVLDHARGGFHGLRVEVKRAGENPRASQDAWHQHLIAEGYCVRVARSVEEILACFLEYLALPRAVPHDAQMTSRP
jgi:hypothetical protein